MIAANRLDPCTEVMALIDQMHRAARDPVRIHQLSDQLEMMTRSYLAPTIPDPLPDTHLSPMEARMLSRLLKGIGSLVTREQLMDAMYYDRADEPQVKIIDVLLCHLRKKLRGSQYRIDGVWGQGYRLESIA